MIRFVYVIGIDATPVKIGTADDPRKRLQLLQIGCPEPLVLHRTLEFPHYAAEPIERAAHEALKDRHRRGEWFNVSIEDAVSTIERVAPRIIDDMREGFRARNDLLHRLQEYGLSDWAESAMGHYRICLNDPARRAEVELMNSAILKVAGIPGLQVFQTVIVKHHAISMAFFNDPAAQRRAEASLARAINALSRYYARGREDDLLSQISATY